MNHALTVELSEAVEEELQRVVQQADGTGLVEFRHMLAYHLGWEGEGAGEEARGKRIRPLLVLLTNAAAGGEWRLALPAAAAVELVHNFSLIHDDIEDNSPLRRGRPTVWKQWGIPQAINSGDAMLTLAHLSLLRLAETSSAEVALQAMRILQSSCLQLTQGQFLDLLYEERGDLTLEAYWPMVGGKTAALLAACTELGALAANASPEARKAYRKFGHDLGLAFQALDDILGIWGDAALTGKSAESDLLAGKKSLPVLFGLGRNGLFANRWQQGSIQPEETGPLAAQLEAEGARAYTQEMATRLTDQALQALSDAAPRGEAGEALNALARQLLDRQG
jgi:geranylgeranyl diphosphate synthase, type I